MVNCGMHDHFQIDFCVYKHIKYRGKFTLLLVVHIPSQHTRNIDVLPEKNDLYAYEAAAATRRPVAL